MKKIKYFIVIVSLIVLCGCGKKEVIVAEWIVSEGEPKENFTASEGDFYYDKTTNHLYQLKSKEWILLGKISNGDKVSNDKNNSDDSCNTNKCDDQTPVISVSEDGFLMINGEKTGSTLKGERGTKGDDGAPGKDGKSPVVSIGEDGYIFINDIKLNFREYKNGCYQIIDPDNDKELDVGEEIKCGTEHFNVVYNNGNKIYMLAKYNLDVGQIYNSKTENLSVIENPTGLQSSKALGFKENLEEWYGVVKFSDKYYWGDLKPIYGFDYPAYVYDSNSEIFNYLQTYKEKLTKIEATVENVRLPKFQEVYSYICYEDEEDCNQQDNPWILNTSFWTGTAIDNKGILFVLSSGLLEVEDAKIAMGLGIRPLVEILDENIIRE